eukprot:scaffold30032_cov85-Phaeocystis_antarctica.AAC.2
MRCERRPKSELSCTQNELSPAAIAPQRVVARGIIRSHQATAQVAADPSGPKKAYKARKGEPSCTLSANSIRSHAPHSVGQLGKKSNTHDVRSEKGGAKLPHNEITSAAITPKRLEAGIYKHREENA